MFDEADPHSNKMTITKVRIKPNLTTTGTQTTSSSIYTPLSTCDSSSQTTQRCLETSLNVINFELTRYQQVFIVKSNVCKNLSEMTTMPLL